MGTYGGDIQRIDDNDFLGLEIFYFKITILLYILILIRIVEDVLLLFMHLFVCLSVPNFVIILVLRQAKQWQKLIWFEKRWA